MSETVFTKIIRGEIPSHRVYEDEKVFAFLDIAPLATGHLLVVPKEPAPTLDLLSDESAAAVGRVLPRLARAVMAATGTRDYNVLQNNGAGPLLVNDGFDRAWRRVGLALDRSGFTVEDRDRSKGVFFVRYIDPDAQDSSGKGWMDSIAFWRPAEKTPQPQYRVLVTGKGESQSEVVVQNAKGEVETSATGKRILALLLEQLK